MKNIRINPFSPIYSICNSGTSLEKLKTYPEFPRYLDVELTNHCNFHCLMCPTGNLSQKRKKGYMERWVFNKLLEEVIKHKTPIRFIRWGEPTLHKNFIEFIQLLKKNGIICHINTNGKLLNENIIEKLMNLGLDSIKFSFQGVDRRSYAEMRNIDYFNELLNKIQLLYKNRGARIAPFIHVSTTVTYESAESIQKFKESINDFCDLVTVGRTVMERVDINNIHLGETEKSLLKSLINEESVIKRHLTCCPEVFDKLSINWDGTVSACCSDYDNQMIVGDLKNERLINIWQSDKLNYYRDLIANSQYDCLELCRTCYDYQGLQTPGLQKT